MLAETAILGVFCAQDLALFVLFFDLTLVPFYFLIGAWGGENRVQATTKFVIYTLAGSLLMLAGGVAPRGLGAPPPRADSFSFSRPAHPPPPGRNPYLIFLPFAAA